MGVMAKKNKKKKKYHAFWVFAKVQLVLVLVVLGACGYYFFGGYAKEVKELKTEAERLVKNSTKETFRGHQTSVVYAADGSVISTLKESRDAYYLEDDAIRRMQRRRLSALRIRNSTVTAESITGRCCAP